MQLRGQNYFRPQTFLIIQNRTPKLFLYSLFFRPDNSRLDFLPFEFSNYEAVSRSRGPIFFIQNRCYIYRNYPWNFLCSFDFFCLDSYKNFSFFPCHFLTKMAKHRIEQLFLIHFCIFRLSGISEFFKIRLTPSICFCTKIVQYMHVSKLIIINSYF